MRWWWWFFAAAGFFFRAEDWLRESSCQGHNSALCMLIWLSFVAQKTRYECHDRAANSDMSAWFCTLIPSKLGQTPHGAVEPNPWIEKLPIITAANTCRCSFLRLPKTQMPYGSRFYIVDHKSEHVKHKTPNNNIREVGQQLRGPEEEP